MRRRQEVGDDDDGAVTLAVVLGRVRAVWERVREARREGKRKGRRIREDEVCAMVILGKMAEEEVGIENNRMVIVRRCFQLSRQWSSKSPRWA